MPFLTAAPRGAWTIARTVPALVAVARRRPSSSPAPAEAESPPSAAALAIARQPLAANDGWAAADGGTTGGSAADDAHVFVPATGPSWSPRSAVTTPPTGQRTPKIVFVAGGIDGNVDDANRRSPAPTTPIPAYSLDAFLAAYDPAVWGRATKPTGPLEDARVRSDQEPGRRININGRRQHHHRRAAAARSSPGST